MVEGNTKKVAGYLRFLDLIAIAENASPQNAFPRLHLGTSLHHR